MSKTDGGPAFPAHPSALGDHDGMTLRDYFAAKAMAAIIQTWPQVNEHAGIRDEESLLNITASDAYRFADAMLAVREAQ